MNYEILATELTSGHPITGAYGADSQVAADQLNASNDVRIKEFMTGSEILEAVGANVIAGLTAVKRGEWLSFCAIDSHSPVNGGVAHKFIEYIFGAGSASIDTLVEARKETVSRATVLSLGYVRSGDVKHARGEV